MASFNVPRWLTNNANQQFQQQAFQGLAQAFLQGQQLGFEREQQKQQLQKAQNELRNVRQSWRNFLGTVKEDPFRAAKENPEVFTHQSTASAARQVLNQATQMSTIQKTAGVREEAEAVFQQLPLEAKGEILSMGDPNSQSFNPQQIQRMGQILQQRRQQATEGLQRTQTKIGPLGTVQSSTFERPEPQAPPTTLGKSFQQEDQIRAQIQQVDRQINQATSDQQVDQLEKKRERLQQRLQQTQQRQQRLAGGQEFNVSVSPDGDVNVRRGPPRQGGTELTTSQLSSVQQRLRGLDRATREIKALRDLLARNPQSVGASGAAGELVVDQTLAQIFPNLAQGERIKTRAAIRSAFEQVKGIITEETRLSDRDVARLRNILPNLGPLTTPQRALTKLDTLLASFARDAASIGSTIEGVEVPGTLQQLQQEFGIAEPQQQQQKAQGQSQEPPPFTADEVEQAFQNGFINRAGLVGRIRKLDETGQISTEQAERIIKRN